MVKEGKLEMKAQSFDQKDPVPNIEIMATFRLVCDINLQDGAEMWVLPHQVN